MMDVAKHDRIVAGTIKRTGRIEAALVNDPEHIVTDSHDGKAVSANGYMIMETKDGRQYVAQAFWFSRYFAINEICEDEDGQLYLETGSRGGVVDLRGVTPAQAVQNYNEQHSDVPHTSNDRIIRYVVF